RRFRRRASGKPRRNRPAEVRAGAASRMRSAPAFPRCPVQGGRHARCCRRGVRRLSTGIADRPTAADRRRDMRRAPAYGLESRWKNCSISTAVALCLLGRTGLRALRLPSGLRCLLEHLLAGPGQAVLRRDHRWDALIDTLAFGLSLLWGILGTRLLFIHATLRGKRRAARQTPTPARPSAWGSRVPKIHPPTVAASTSPTISSPDRTGLRPVSLDF